MSPVLGVVGLLIVGAAVCAVMSAYNPPKVPLWVATMLLAVAMAVSFLPK